MMKLCVWDPISMDPNKLAKLIEIKRPQDPVGFPLGWMEEECKEGLVERFM